MLFSRKPNIEKLKATNNVLGLIKALRHKDPQVGKDAVLALGQIGEPAKDAVPALIEALSDENVSVSSKVADALGEIGEPAVEIPHGS